MLTFGVVSAYLADSPLVLQPDISVEFVAADGFDAWWEATVAGAYGGADYDQVGPWEANSNSIDRPRTGPRSARQLTTDQDGAGRAPLAPGNYVVCVDFGHPYRTMIAGCGPASVGNDTTVYVFFDEGRAFVDGGDGSASDAYRRLSCRQQLRLGQQPEHLVHLGGGRYRCPSR